MGEFDGLVAAVTGGASGIGAAERYGLYRDLYPCTADTVHALAARQER
jgi:hypothetical protein